MKLNEVFLRISPKKFHFLKFILEGYDNLAILSSYRIDDGIVVIRYPNDMTKEVFSVIGNIADYLSTS